MTVKELNHLHSKVNTLNRVLGVWKKWAEWDDYEILIELPDIHVVKKGKNKHNQPITQERYFPHQDLNDVIRHYRNRINYKKDG